MDTVGKIPRGSKTRGHQLFALKNSKIVIKQLIKMLTNVPMMGTCENE